jgi:hypothetical protein
LCEIVEGIDGFIFAALAVEGHQKVADEDRMVHFLFDLIDYLLGLFSVLLQLGPCLMQFQEGSV